jgi:hypothetical protein
MLLVLGVNNIGISVFTLLYSLVIRFGNPFQEANLVMLEISMGNISYSFCGCKAR